MRGAQKIIEEAIISSGLKKHKRLYLLRHSRATHLCKHLTEAQMCIYFGWTIGTKVVRRYIHLSGKDLDNTLLSIGQGKQIQHEEYQLKTIKCNRCSETLISPTMQFCGRCGLPTKISEQYTKEIDLENENNQLKLEIASIRQEMNQKMTMLIDSHKEILECLKYPDKLTLISKE